MSINISNAIPIQFWPLGVPTYNEKPEPGVDHACYFKKWNAEDEIALQFYDTSDFNYQLEILDKAGTGSLILTVGWLTQLKRYPEP